MRPAALIVALALTQATEVRPSPPEAREIAPETFLVQGAMLPNRGPDGNTVIFMAPDGLVVVDTGRHAWHSDGILAFAAARRQPVRAIVNTHWHLDHSSGNGRIKAAHPEARVYASRAVERALAPDGFLTRSAAAARARTPEPTDPPTRAEETAVFLSTMAASHDLQPDVPVSASATLRLAGRPFSVRVAEDAVTDADLWLFDESTGVAVLGDLVTLPAPFFETACPMPWQAALDAVWNTPFIVAVPGHGEPMTRAEFDRYRRAFGAFRTCAGSAAAPDACAAAWTRDVDALLETDADRRQATAYAAHYVGFLRANGGVSPDCRVKPPRLP